MADVVAFGYFGQRLPVALPVEICCRERDGIALNVHYDGDGAIIYKHACALGCEGIVSKRSAEPPPHGPKMSQCSKHHRDGEVRG
jgi:hypothetical protein